MQNKSFSSVTVRVSVFFVSRERLAFRLRSALAVVLHAMKYYNIQMWEKVGELFNKEKKKLKKKWKIIKKTKMRYGLIVLNNFYFFFWVQVLLS